MSLGFVLAGRSIAGAPTPPRLSWSFYVEQNDSNPNPTAASGNAYSLGCAQGQGDSSAGQNSDVQLLFGGQNSSNTGATNGISGNFQSYSMIEEYVEHVAWGYWNCTGDDNSTVMHIDVATNNDSNVSSTTGGSWANVVQAAHNWSVNEDITSQLDIRGGNDIEPSFGSWQSTFNWQAGYSSVTNLLYESNGSADGCPGFSTSGGAGQSCNNGWDQHAVYMTSWGFQDAIANPQIYNSTQPHQWAEISYYGAEYANGDISFTSLMDNYAKNSGALTPANAWNTFWGAINYWTVTAMTPLFRTEVHDSGN